MEMNRRQLLGTAGSVLLPGLAGCSSDSVLGNDTEEHLQAAGEALEEADTALSEEADKFEDSNLENGGVDIETEAVVGHLETASEELDAAEGGANDSQQETIDAARDWISLARGLIDFLDVFAEGYTDVATGLTYFQSERYEDAADRLGTASETLAETEQQLTVVRDRADNLGSESEDMIDEVDLTSLEADIDTLAQIIDALVPMANGIRQVSLGMVDFNTATTALENEQYRDAESSYTSARDHFSTAESTFTELEGTAPDNIQNSVIELTCYSGALKESADHFANAANALASGDNERANEEAEMGEESLNQCNFD